MDGLFGLSLSPFDEYDSDRTLYYHSMSGFREFRVETSVIRNETGWKDSKDSFRVLGQSRGKSGHVSSSWMDRRGEYNSSRENNAISYIFNQPLEEFLGTATFRASPLKRLPQLFIQGFLHLRAAYKSSLH